MMPVRIVFVSGVDSLGRDVVSLFSVPSTSNGDARRRLCDHLGVKGWDVSDMFVKQIYMTAITEIHTTTTERGEPD